VNTFDRATIYDLLPVEIRLRDQQDGRVVEALCGIIASQAQIVEANLGELYDDLFIETCAPWAIPYTGDLIGYRPLRSLGPDGATSRADVADTIGYRRRKGTVVVLEQLGYDVTGWPTIAVEFFSLLMQFQYVRNHVRPANRRFDAHDLQTQIDITTAFDQEARSVDVRRIGSGRGRYNIPNLGIFVWRLHPYGGATLDQVPAKARNLAKSAARRVGANRYTFDPFGDDVQLVNPPRALRAPFSVGGRWNVPFALPRLPLYNELETARAAAAVGAPFASDYFGSTPVLAVFEADGTPIESAKICVCDLETWTAPTEAGIRVAVDPILGRFVFDAAPDAGAQIDVTYAYAFSGDYGGGTYARPVPPDEAAHPLEVLDLASAAPSSWTSGIVEIDDSGAFAGNVTLKPAGSLVIRAASFARPVFLGDVTIDAAAGSSVTLRGVALGGSLTVSGTGPFTLRLEHATVRSTLTWAIDLGGALVVDHTLCSALFVHPDVTIDVADSIVDGAFVSATADPAFDDTRRAIAAADGTGECGSLSIARSTIFGGINAREVGLIENSIVTGIASVERTQGGCVRYSFIPDGSTVPRRFRCQPDGAIDADTASALRSNPALTKAQAAAIRADVLTWLFPAFTSRLRNTGGYAQLADTAPAEIRLGAEDGDEMGVFFRLYGPRREANLKFRLDEYVRIGLEFGIIHAT
jgi:hypothetical protein